MYTSYMIKRKYNKLVEQFGPRGAKVLLAASVAFLFVPLPFASLIPVTVAKGVVWLTGK